MYERFYGLTERPFELTPNPRYLFLSPRHAEVVINAAGANTLNSLYNDNGLRWNGGRPDQAIINKYYAGLDAAWRETADLQVEIPMRGTAADSLNASAAAAVLLFEAVRQRGLGR